MYKTATTDTSDGDSAIYYQTARRAAQYIKSVAVESVVVSGGDTDTVCVKWSTGFGDTLYTSTHCDGTPGVIAFLDTMYLFAQDKADGDTTTDLNYAMWGIRWLMNKAQRVLDTVQIGPPLEVDTLYWWYRFPDAADNPQNFWDTSYSAVWGRGVAGISETFLMAHKDLRIDSQDLQDTLWHYAEGGARWVFGEGSTSTGGLRWQYMHNEYPYDPPSHDTTWYFNCFCKGQGPILRYFLEMYDYARTLSDADSTFYFDCADTGYKYLDATKIPGYEGGYCWDGKVLDPERSDSDKKTISVSVENGPPGLGLTMLDAANILASAGHADSINYQNLATYTADWLNAEFHIDSIIPSTAVGSYKWTWHACEDSIEVEIINLSDCGDPCELSSGSGDSCICSLYVHNRAQSQNASKTVFWWVDFLKWNKKFGFKGDSGTVAILPNSSHGERIAHGLDEWDNLPAYGQPVSVNGSAGYWLDTQEGARQNLYSIDHDCFRVYVCQ
jgi:hypothetical protein